MKLIFTKWLTICALLGNYSREEVGVAVAHRINHHHHQKMGKARHGHHKQHVQIEAKEGEEVHDIVADDAEQPSVSSLTEKIQSLNQQKSTTAEHEQSESEVQYFKEGQTLKEFFTKVNQGKDITHAFDIFANPTDMENYGADAMSYAMENIKVLDNKVIKKGGRRCNAQDWATVHWQTYDNDGKKLEDS